MTLRYTLGYALLFGLTAFLYRYDQWLSLPPASIHQWRQADGAAIAWNYARNPDFSDVKICNLFYAGDAHAVGELPILYWFSGLITRYFNFPAYPLRWIGLALLFFAGWVFGWMILRQTGRPDVAVPASGLLLSAPVLGYYGPGFLPDAPAFCFILMMAACLWQANRTQGTGWLAAASAAAALAILLKLSMAIAPLALAATWVAGKRTGRWQGMPLWNGIGPSISMAGIAIAVAAFRWWIAQYNAAHHATYFLASARPVWNYDLPFILETIRMMARTGLPAYASAGLYLTSLGGLWFHIKYWKSISFVAKNLFLFTGLGSLAYFLLWFRMFREHDYYAVCLLVIPALLLLNGLRPAMRRYAGKHILYALYACLLAGISHNHYILSERLQLAFHPETSRNLPPGAFLPAGEPEKSGVPLQAKVLCPEDPSPNIALLALRRYGWTAYNFGDRITADTLYKYQTKFGLSHLALRDTAAYGDLYRRFFPVRVCTIEHWHLYSR